MPALKLIESLDKMKGVIQEENALLEKMNLREALEKMKEKEEAIRVFYGCFDEFKKRKESGLVVDQKVREHVRAVLQEVNLLSQENQTLLDRALLANQRVLSLMREGLLNSSKTAMVYSAQGQFKKNQTPYGGKIDAYSFNRAL